MVLVTFSAQGGLMMYGLPVKESVNRLTALAREPRLEMRVFEGAGHGLMDGETRELLPDFLDAVSDWALRYSGARQP